MRSSSFRTSLSRRCGRSAETQKYETSGRDFVSLLFHRHVLTFFYTAVFYSSRGPQQHPGSRAPRSRFVCHVCISDYQRVLNRSNSFYRVYGITCVQTFELQLEEHNIIHNYFHVQVQLLLILCKGPHLFENTGKLLDYGSLLVTEIESRWPPYGV